MLEGFPLILGFPAAAAASPVQISTASAQTLVIRSWLWLNGQPAQESPSLHVSAGAIQIGLPSHSDLMGLLLEVCIEASSSSPRVHTLSVHQG